MEKFEQRVYGVPLYSSAEALLGDPGLLPTDVTLRRLQTMKRTLNAKRDGVTFYIRKVSKADKDVRQQWGPDVQEVLDKMPASVHFGTDTRVSLYQMRLSDRETFEGEMHTTTLLALFLVRHDQQDACVLLPGDETSHANWATFQKLHRKMTARKLTPPRT